MSLQLSSIQRWVAVHHEQRETALKHKTERSSDTLTNFPDSPCLLPSKLMQQLLTVHMYLVSLWTRLYSLLPK